MQVAGESRVAMVAAAADLFRRQGYDATSWRQITAAGEAPPGSIGFLFPSGKEQLAVEVVAKVSATTRNQIATLLSGRAPAEALQRWVLASARLLAESDYTDGCPIATLALEMAHRSPEIQREIAAGYESWSEAVADCLAPTHGDNAHATAEIVLAAFEGALLLSRARRTTEPLELLAQSAPQLLSAFIEGHRTDDTSR
jgi:TetR/AcrR family transcriptional regulator, lmrAB and yxaGH operons repressor